MNARSTNETPAWGHYRPRLQERLLLRLSGSLPAVPPLSNLALLLRRPLKYGVDTPLDVVRWHLRLRLHRRDSLSESRVLFTPQLFDAAERRVLLERLRPGDTFIDAGANVGAYSFWVYDALRERVRIIAIEPDPELGERIEFNIATNGASSIELVPAALSDREGEAVLIVSRLNRGENALSSDAPASAGVVVRTRTLVALLQERNVDAVGALKIDIEGMEWRVLEHFFRHADRALQPRCILFEMKDTAEHRSLREFLGGQGYAEVLRTGRNVMVERP